MQQPPQMSRHKGGWALTTAKVLSHLRNVSQCAERTATDQEQAAIKQVWGYVGVGMDEYEIGGDGQWKNIAPERREGVRQRLRDGFIDDAFLPGGDGHEARKRFKRADLLKWGDRLLAAAAAHAAGPAVTTDDDSTGPITVISPTLAGLPEATRLIVEDIMERAAAAGYELSDWDELVHYARNRYVEAAGEFGAVDAARDKVLAPALPDDAPFDDDLSELYENVSRSRSGRDGASVISDFSLSSRLSGLSFVSQREALRRLHRDMIDNRVSVDTIPGLKKTRSKLQKAARKIRKAGTRGAKKVKSFFTGKR